MPPESSDLFMATLAGGTARSFGDGRYSVQSVLGEGGQKVVYLVRDSALERDCTLSLIKTEVMEPADLAVLAHEAQAMGKLHHPNIVVVHNIGDDAGRPYVVCEYVAGGDLRKLMQSGGAALPLGQAVGIARDVAAALAHAHARDVIHRDVKPGNVWLTEDGTAKLGDFGLALRTDRSLSGVRGVMVGTVTYMPPEQALGERADARSDLYSLGAMLYEMVTGRPPFLGDDVVSVISQHINTAPVHPSWHNPQISRPLEELILRLLAKVPADRYQNAGDVCDALAAMAGDSDGELRLPVVGSNPLDRLAAGIFVGREAETEALRHAFDDAQSGRARLLLVMGEPGIGKTRLAEELATYARLRNAQILWGRCYDGEGAPAYWPWAQLIRAYAYDREPAALLSELGSGAADIVHVVSELRERLPDVPPAPSSDPEQARFRLFDGVTTFLKNASKNQALVLVLDDLHWADKPSLLLLQFLAREMRGARLLIIGTYRDVALGRQHPLAQTLGELAREHLSERVQLHGLTEQDVHRFVSMTAGFEPPTGLVSVVYKETEGNPFFIHEVVRLLVSDGRLKRADEVTSWSVAIPEGVREVVGRRLNRLSEECNRVLTIASVIGREFTLEALEQLSELDDDRLLDVVEEAMGARVIVEVPQAVGRYSFSHSLIRETLYDELTTTRRVRLHRRIAAALEELYKAKPGQHLSELAYHFLEAVHAGGDIHKAVRYAVGAAEHATAAVAYEEAVAYYDRALQANELHEPPDDLERCDLLLGLGDAKWRTGDFGASRLVFADATSLAHTLHSPERLAMAALGMGGGFSDFDTGNTEDQGLAGALGDALDAIGAADGPLAAKLMARLAECLVFSPDDDQRRSDLARNAIAMARRIEDPLVLSYVLRAAYVALARPAEAEERLAMATEAVALTESAGDKLLALQGQMLRMVELLHLGDAVGAAAAFDWYSRTTSEIRHRYNLWATEVWTGTNLILAGRFDDAERTIQQALVVGQREQNANALPLFALQLAVLRREQGRLGELEPAMRGYASQNPRFPAWRCALAILCLEAGNEEEAREIAKQLADEFANLHEDWFWLTGMTLLAELYAGLGDRDRAAMLYPRLLPYAARNVLVAPGAGCFGSVSRYLGMLATCTGHWNRAADHFEQAIAFNERLASPPLVAQTRFEYARMLTRRGQPGDAKQVEELLALAEDVAERLGMGALLRKLKVERSRSA